MYPFPDFLKEVQQDSQGFKENTLRFFKNMYALPNKNITKEERIKAH